MANANPASVHSATVAAVIAPETISELSSPWLSGASSSAFFTLPKNEVLGSHGGVAEDISAFVCEAITTV